MLDQINHMVLTPEPALRPSLLPGLADHHLPYLVPAIVYWVIGFSFHYIDTRGLLSAYKLHTPAEDLTKNRATKKDVVKFALFQQACQCTLGYLTSAADDFVPHEYGIIRWVRVIRYTRILTIEFMRDVGFDLAWILSEPNTDGSAPIVPFQADIYGSQMGNLSQAAIASMTNHSASSTVEIIGAKSMYWLVVPLLQYFAVMVLADTLQYFTHRAFHVNRWLYRHIHSMHHEIYVPYAYGAFYNHPLETIPVDMIGFPICLAIAGLDNRQSAFFGAIWTFKTVVDHCGYDFPYNPCNIVCPNSVLFHDLHHQTWGMKYNFSVYGSFWDWLMSTKWSPHDVRAQEKYQKGKVNAEAVAAKRLAGDKTLDMSVANATAVDL